MIYTYLTNKALKLAYQAHHGQFDQSGVPYIFHPYHLAEQMTDEITVCVALLHDVIEDTPVTLEELEKEFPPVVTDALRLLTRDKETDYYDYVYAIGQNPVARAVKMADIAHNLDETRLEGSQNLVQEQREHYRRKYSRAWKILTETDQTK